jgi:hypothetical protein
MPLTAGPLHVQVSIISTPTRRAVLVIVYAEAPLARRHFARAAFERSCEQLACAVFVVMTLTLGDFVVLSKAIGLVDL